MAMAKASTLLLHWHWMSYFLMVAKTRPERIYVMFCTRYTRTVYTCIYCTVPLFRLKVFVSLLYSGVVVNDDYSSYYQLAKELGACTTYVYISILSTSCTQCQPRQLIPAWSINGTRLNRCYTFSRVTISITISEPSLYFSTMMTCNNKNYTFKQSKPRAIWKHSFEPRASERHPIWNCLLTC